MTQHPMAPPLDTDFNQRGRKFFLLQSRKFLFIVQNINCCIKSNYYPLGVAVGLAAFVSADLSPLELSIMDLILAAPS